jgi:hypothetical protein
MGVIRVQDGGRFFLDNQIIEHDADQRKGIPVAFALLPDFGHYAGLCASVDQDGLRLFCQTCDDSDRFAHGEHIQPANPSCTTHQNNHAVRVRNLQLIQRSLNFFRIADMGGFDRYAAFEWNLSGDHISLLLLIQHKSCAKTKARCLDVVRLSSTEQPRHQKQSGGA